MARILILAVIAPVVVLGVLGSAQSEVITAVETARGEYEAGTFTTGEPEFSYRFEVDEKAGRAKLTEMIRLVNKTVIDVGVEYVIVASEDGASASGTFLLSESRRNQRILTAKRQLGRKSCAYCAIAVSRSAVRRRGAIS